MSKPANKKRKPRTNTEDKTFSSRRAAFRAAKRDLKIPMRNQPAKVLSSSQPPGWEDTKMDSRNSRLYIFKLFRMLFGKREEDEIHFREDKPVEYKDGKGKQLGHFNTGPPTGKIKKSLLL